MKRGKTARWGRSPGETGDPPRPDSEDGGDVVTTLHSRARALFHRLGGQDGATAVEYALMAMLIAMVVFAAVQFLGQNTNNAFSSMTFPP